MRRITLFFSFILDLSWYLKSVILERWVSRILVNRKEALFEASFEFARRIDEKRHKRTEAIRV